MYEWDGNAAGDELERLKGVIPVWIKGGPAYVGGLLWRLGPADTVRLFELLGETGGLTPTEARPWLEPPVRAWSEIETILSGILDMNEARSIEIPAHLLRWLERHRAILPATAQPLTEAQQATRAALVRRHRSTAYQLARYAAIPQPTPAEADIAANYELCCDQALEALAEFDRHAGARWHVSTHWTRA